MGQNYKHIFIGCGGAGVNTISLIKKRIYDSQKSTASKSKLAAMNEKYRFLFFDTDQRDIDKYNKEYRDTFENGMVPFINPQTDLISLSKGNPHAIYVEAKNNPTPMINQRILEACTDDLAAKIPDQPLKFGAGAFRMKSRLSFARSLSEFQQKLQAAIEDLNSVKNTGGAENTIFYWVVCSTNGGTGSGIINDILYYVNMQHQRSIGDGDPHLVLTMYMPKYYIDKNSTEEKYSINAFAVFKEIEGIKAMSNDADKCKIFHRLALLKDYNLIDTDARYDPFYYLIPIDCQTDNGTNIGDSLYPNTATLLYYIHEGEGGEALHSDVDNYMHDLYNLRPKGFLVPMGYIALRKPTVQFDQYMNARLEQDLLQFGLVNEVKAPKVEEKDVKKYFESLFGAESGISFLKSFFTTRAEMAIEDVFSSIDVSVSKKADEIGLNEQLIENAFGQFDSKEQINKVEVDAVKLIKSNLWKKAEDLIREHGLFYAKGFFKKLGEVSASSLTELEDLSKREDEGAKERLEKLEKEANKIDFKENFKKDDQLEDLRQYKSELENAARRKIECKIAEIELAILSNFCRKDGEGEIKNLEDRLTNLLESAKQLSSEAQDKYKKLADNFADLSLDVTSVYLPEMSTICDGNGWIRNNVFSSMYEELVSVTPEVIEGKDKVPVRNGKKSIEEVIGKLYNTSGTDVISKEINKAFACKLDKESDNSAESGKSANRIASEEDIRFFTNPEDKGGDSIRGRLEKFVNYAKRRFEEDYKKNETVKSQWLDRGIIEFFENLDIENREKVRRSLNPSLFFNYKENKLAVDYREFLIFVAKNADVASSMLGYQPGNTKHRFIKGSNDNEALVIRAKYGLSFSDYRMYDTMEDQYEKAPNRDKYHFHHYYAEFGENIRMEDLPFEISEAHRIFTKMILLNKYTKNFSDLGFFFTSPYKSKAADFSDAMLIFKTPSSFSIARPGALSEDAASGTICMKVIDKNARLYADFQGNSFVEAFEEYRKNFIRNAVADTFNKFLNAVVRHSGKDGDQAVTGGKIIENHYDEYRDSLLNEFDEKIQSARTDKEKALYKIFMYVLENDLTTARVFMTGKKN